MGYIAYAGTLDRYVFEKVNEVGNWHSVLKNISSEIQHIRGSSQVLTIIDPYFFNVEFDEVEQFAQALVSLLKNNDFCFVQVFSKKNIKWYNREFAERLRQNQHGIAFRFTLIPKDIHDRFWITNALTGVVVGASFNGLGKKLSMIYRISEEDMEVLNEELLKRGINCRPDLG